MPTELGTVDGIIPSFRFGSGELPINEGDAGGSIAVSKGKSTLGRVSIEVTTLGTGDTWASGIAVGEGDTNSRSDDPGASRIALGKDPSLNIFVVELSTSTTGEDATGLAGGLVVS